jgi:hypothetical protein
MEGVEWLESHKSGQAAERSGRVGAGFAEGPR